MIDPFPHNHDAFAPREIAARVGTVGVSKARTETLSLLVLAVLAGAFITLGGALYLVAVSGSTAGLGATRLLGGVAFSLGLVLVVVAGAELFTGNNLVVMAWASRRIGTRELLRNWGLVYIGNVCGALSTTALLWLAGVHELGGGVVGETARAVAADKAGLDPSRAFAAGVLCNALVCLAVWLSIGGRSVTDKILGVVFPVTAFVALGLEHSIANWFFLPYGALLGELPADFYSRATLNLLVVSLGNVLGGSGLVAGVYWLAYERSGSTRAGQGDQ